MSVAASELALHQTKRWLFPIARPGARTGRLSSARGRARSIGDAVQRHTASSAVQAVGAGEGMFTGRGGGKGRGGMEDRPAACANHCDAADPEIAPGSSRDCNDGHHPQRRRDRLMILTFRPIPSRGAERAANRSSAILLHSLSLSPLTLARHIFPRSIESRPRSPVARPRLCTTNGRAHRANHLDDLRPSACGKLSEHSSR